MVKYSVENLGQNIWAQMPTQGNGFDWSAASQRQNPEEPDLPVWSCPSSTEHWVSLSTVRRKVSRSWPGHLVPSHKLLHLISLRCHVRAIRAIVSRWVPLISLLSSHPMLSATKCSWPGPMIAMRCVDCLGLSELLWRGLRMME